MTAKTDEKARKVAVFTREITRLESLLASRQRKVENAEGKLADARTRLQLAKDGKL